MEIRNNLLSYLKKKYLQDLLEYYDEKEAEQLLTILIEDFFGISRNELVMNPDRRLTESELLRLHKAVKELKQYKPVQYITGVVEFHGLKLEVNSNVLIPRPETEELVQIVADGETAEGLIVLDVGTGSGCISLSLQKLLDNASVYATDISDEAINLAKRNAVAVSQDVTFYTHDILVVEEPINDQNGERVLFDIIVSNPPYVTPVDRSKMHANVLNYEPHNALFVPENNPMIYYEAILKFSKSNLKPGGRLYFEINESLGDEMLLLFRKFGYLDAKLFKDIRGKYRFVSSCKPLT